jgi:curved DNA-binding protein
MASTDFRDYYAILGVGKSASHDDIKQAFRKLARKYHPDLNPGDRAAEARFKEINEAYEILSDPDKRKKYDQFGQYWKQADNAWPGGGSPVDFGGFDFSQYGSFDDFINELLGRFGSQAPGGRQRSGRSPGPGFGDFSGFTDPSSVSGGDLDTDLSLTMAEAFHGVQKRLRVGQEDIQVKIPAGVTTGKRIRVRGKGQANPYTQQRGDLYLNVTVQPHEFFQFEGDNLLCELPIAPDEAALGAAVEVPTPDGMVTVTIPAGIRSGQTLRLRGKGWPNPKGGRTDQLVRVAIAVPKTLTAAERDCYETLRAQRTSDPRQGLANMSL